MILDYYVKWIKSNEIDRLHLISIPLRCFVVSFPNIIKPEIITMNNFKQFISTIVTTIKECLGKLNSKETDISTFLRKRLVDLINIILALTHYGKYYRLHLIGVLTYIIVLVLYCKIGN